MSHTKSDGITVRLLKIIIHFNVGLEWKFKRGDFLAFSVPQIA